MDSLEFLCVGELSPLSLINLFGHVFIPAWTRRDLLCTSVYDPVLPLGRHGFPQLGSWPFDNPSVGAPVRFITFFVAQDALFSFFFFFHPHSWLFLVLFSILCFYKEKCLSCPGPRVSSCFPRVARDCAAPSWLGRGSVCSFSHSCVPPTPPPEWPSSWSPQTDLDRRSAGEEAHRGVQDGSPGLPPPGAAPRPLGGA